MYYGNGVWGIGLKKSDMELFEKYYNNYKYNLKDKEIFDKIVNIVLEKHDDDYYTIDYFLITDSDYYICTNNMYQNEGQAIYKYDITKNTLNKILEWGSGDLLYFKQN